MSKQVYRIPRFLAAPLILTADGSIWWATATMCLIGISPRSLPHRQGVFSATLCVYSPVVRHPHRARWPYLQAAVQNLEQVTRHRRTRRYWHGGHIDVNNR